MTRFVSILMVCLLASGLGTAPLHAQDIPAPDGPVILRVTGDIAVTNVGDALEFDRESFAALDDTIIETTTIWTEGGHSFQGVSLHILTERLGVTDGILQATAINDYTVEIPVSDAVPGGPIVAYRMDGADMSVRDKGPLWVIYPYDSSPEYRTAVINARSIWQLDRLHVVQ